MEETKKEIEQETEQEVEKVIIKPETRVRLFKDVGVNVEHGYYFYFKNKTERDNYFLSQPGRDTLCYHVFEGDTIDTDLPVLETRQYRYLMYKNKGSDWMYSTIDNSVYVNEEVTSITHSTDIFTSYFHDIVLPDRAFIERQHSKNWERKKKHLMPRVESRDGDDLFIGDEYELVRRKRHSWQIAWQVYVFSETPDKYKGSLSSKGLATPLYFACVPFLPRMLSLPSGDYIPVMYGGKPVSLPDRLNKKISYDSKWVNKVVATFITADLPWNTKATVKTNSNGVPTRIDLGASGSFEHHVDADGVRMLYVKRNTNITINSTRTINFGYVYDDTYIDSCSRLHTFPYFKASISNLRGHQFDLKPELLTQGEIHVGVVAGLGTSNKISYFPLNYVNDPTDGHWSDGQQMIMAFRGFIDTNNNDLPIKSDYLAAMMQGNRNQIEASRTAASNLLSTANSNADTSYNATMSAAQNDLDLAGQYQSNFSFSNREVAGTNAAQAGAAYDKSLSQNQQSGSWGIIGGLGGAAVGGVTGLLGGPVGVGAGIVGGYQLGSGVGSQFGSSHGLNNPNTTYQDLYRDRARENAKLQLGAQQDWMNKTAAVGFENSRISAAATSAIAKANAGTQYDNTQMMLNARVSDASNVAPTMNAMGGDINFDLQNSNFDIVLTTWQLQDIQKPYIRFFYNAYGEKHNRYTKMNLTSRTRFNYIKTNGLIVGGNVNTYIANAIESIFNAGVTLWHDKSTIGQPWQLNVEKEDAKIIQEIDIGVGRIDTRLAVPQEKLIYKKTRERVRKNDNLTIEEILEKTEYIPQKEATIIYPEEEYE